MQQSWICQWMLFDYHREKLWIYGMTMPWLDQSWRNRNLFPLSCSFLSNNLET